MPGLVGGSLHAADLLGEDFKSYTTDLAVPTLSAEPSASGDESSGQPTALVRMSATGSGGKIAWLNDVIAGTGGSRQLELNTRAATVADYSGLTRHHAVESNTDLTNAAGCLAVSDFSEVTGAGQIVAGTPTLTRSETFFRLKAWLP